MLLFVCSRVSSNSPKPRTHNTAESDLEHLIPPTPPECRAYRQSTPCPAPFQGVLPTFWDFWYNKAPAAFSAALQGSLGLSEAVTGQSREEAKCFLCSFLIWPCYRAAASQSIPDNMNRVGSESIHHSSPCPVAENRRYQGPPLGWQKSLVCFRHFFLTLIFLIMCCWWLYFSVTDTLKEKNSTPKECKNTGLCTHCKQNTGTSKCK